MVTFIPLEQGCDNNFSTTVISNFNTTSLQWDSYDFYPNKINNLKSCPVKAGFTSVLAPALMADEQSDNSTSIIGLEIDILKEIL